MSKTVVVIPTINEYLGLRALLPALLKYNCDVLVIDDISDDGSRELLAEVKKNNPWRVNYILNSHKQGLKSAYFQGFNEIISQKYDSVLMMDGDGAHDPDHIIEMQERLSSGYNLVIGSRYIKNGKIVDFSLERRITSRLGNALCKFYISRQVNDWTTGYMMWDLEMLKRVINKDYIDGFGFLIQMKKYALDEGARIFEMPISFSNCTNNNSKYNHAMAREALKMIRAISKSKSKK